MIRSTKKKFYSHIQILKVTIDTDLKFLLVMPLLNGGEQMQAYTYIFNTKQVPLMEVNL